MKKLSELSHKIKQWNLMGYNKLPQLQIAIIHSKQYNKQIICFLQQISCSHLLYKQQSSNSQNLNSEKQQKSQTVKQEKYPKSSTFKQAKQKQNKISIQKQQKKASQQQFAQLKNTIYATYSSNNKLSCLVHMILDNEDNQKISDMDFKNTIKIIQKLKRNSQIIFINFNPLVYNLQVKNEYLQQFGLTFKSNQRQIKLSKFNSKYLKQNSKNLQLNNKIKKINSKQMNDKNQQITTQRLCQQIQKKYTYIFGFQINKNFTDMKIIFKDLKNSLKRYELLLQLKNNFSSNSYQKSLMSHQKSLISYQNSLRFDQKQLTSYAFRCLYQSKQYLIAGLMGLFSISQSIRISKQKNQMNEFQLKQLKSKSLKLKQTSIHWQIMQLVNQLWEIQGDALLKEIDKMPLTYIQQRFKMLNYQSIGGFMPSSCFQSIFSPPLRKMVDQIFQTLKAVEFKILTFVQLTLECYFESLNICDQLIDKQYQNIQKICKQFRKQTAKTLNSQIEYISASPEDFWSYKQLKSSLYSQQQQIYIQIKYIGKTYIKKVFENMRQTVPRLIGQNLLKTIANYLQRDSLNSLIQILRQSQIEITISSSELKFLESRRQLSQRLDKLIYYFSLKTNSLTSIKNHNERTQKNWNRMYKRKIIQAKQTQQEKQDKGFLAWAKKLFQGKPKQKQIKRSNSQKLLNQRQNQQILNQNLGKTTNNNKEHGLSQKNWLLIINIDKHVQNQKINQSAHAGFPSRLRPAIWLYLAKRGNTSKMSKVSTTLKTFQNCQTSEQQKLEQTFRQIQKDVLRTPPPSVFKNGYLKDSLTRILRAYAIIDVELRYTQGMNFIVGIILCVITSYGQKSQYIDINKNQKYFNDIEDKALLIFQFMMNQKALRKIMFIERQTITDLCVRLQKSIQKWSPYMSQKINQSGFSVEMIFSGALISGLTTSDILFSIQKRIIDMLITYDFSILYKIIAKFTAAAQPLCKNLQNENLYFFLKGKFYNDVYSLIGQPGLQKMFQTL